MTKQCHNETSDAYGAVVARLNPAWRVITCRGRLQWILQRRKKGGGEWPWRAVAYCRTRAALTRLAAASCGQIDPAAWAVLAALPDHIAGARA